MNVSELQSALENAKQQHNDAPCFAYGKNSSNPTKPEVEFTIHHFDNDAENESVTNVLEDIEKAIKEADENMRHHYDIWCDERVFEDSFSAGYVCALEQVKHQLQLLVENGLP